MEDPEALFTLPTTSVIRHYHPTRGRSFACSDCACLLTEAMNGGGRDKAKGPARGGRRRFDHRGPNNGLLKARVRWSFLCCTSST